MITLRVAVVACIAVVTAVSLPAAGAAEAQTPTTAPSSSDPAAPSTAPPTTARESTVDVLTASRDEVLDRVAGLDARIRSAEEAASTAQAEVDAANAAAMTAGAKAQQAQALADEATDDVRSYAVEAFVRPPAQDALSTLSISETRDAAYATDVLKIVAQQRRQVIDTMVAAKAVADRERTAAQTALDAAHAEVAAARTQLDELRAVRTQQSRLASQLDDRLDAKLAEAAALAEVDAKAAQVVTAQEVSLRSTGPASPSAAPSTSAPSKPAATAPGPTTPRPPVTSPPRPTVPNPPTTTSPPVSVPGLVTWSDVTKAGGIWVHKSIAGDVSALISAARAAGFSLSGGGYRDPASQIQLRIAHCGSSSYAIYEMPASQCTPPTARPGRSMHERGLALDLQSSGHLITSRSDPAFVWLAANAGQFGFRNLPSEPWHWSTNGS